MTNHKKGSAHWTADYKKCKEERDALLAKISESVASTDAYEKLLQYVYETLGSYYCNTEDLRIKIKNSGLLK